MEALRAAHIEMWSRNFVDQIGWVCTQSWRRDWHIELLRLEHFNQIAYRFRTIGPSSVLCTSGSHTFVATLCLLQCCLFYFRLIYNEWFVTKSSWSSWSNTAGVLKRTSVSACWGILNLFITLLPIRYVLKLKCAKKLSECVGFILIFILAFCLGFQCLKHQKRVLPFACSVTWLPTGFIGSRENAHCRLLGTL